MKLYDRITTQRRKLDEWVAAGVALVGAYQTGQHYYLKYKERLAGKETQSRYVLSIEEHASEALFWNTVRWVMGQVEQKARRSIYVTQFSGRVIETPSPESESYRIEWDGYDLLIKIDTPGVEEEEGGTSLKVVGGKFSWGKTMHVVCPSLEAREKFQNFLETMIPKHEPETYIPWVYRARESGGWSAVKRLIKRSPETLVLVDGQFDDMRADIEKFRNDRQRYVDLGIPWHRGYLLHGPPGTGKSSTICTLASEFGSDVYFLSLAELKDGGALIEAMNELDSGDFLVLEDVDTATAAAGEGEGKEQAIFDTLLNTLDGVLTPDGLIVIMTTNHPKKLDERLVRPGRVDKVYCLDYLTQQQLDQMLKVFLGVPAGSVKLRRNDLAPAKIIECLKSSIDYDTDYVLKCVKEVAAQSKPEK